MRTDALLAARGLDEAFRQAGTLRERDHPAHDVAAEEVEDHIQREVEIRDRALQLRNVPGPDLIRCRRDELGLDVCRMPRLGAPFPHFVGLGHSGVKGGAKLDHDGGGKLDHLAAGRSV